MVLENLWTEHGLVNSRLDEVIDIVWAADLEDP